MATTWAFHVDECEGRGWERESLKTQSDIQTGKKAVPIQKQCYTSYLIQQEFQKEWPRLTEFYNLYLRSVGTLVEERLLACV